ncbi:hypothetical protein ES705_15216 [subsurface metagenome]
MDTVLTVIGAIVIFFGMLTIAIILAILIVVLFQYLIAKWSGKND